MSDEQFISPRKIERKYGYQPVAQGPPPTRPPQKPPAPHAATFPTLQDRLESIRERNDPRRGGPNRECEDWVDVCSALTMLKQAELAWRDPKEPMCLYRERPDAACLPVLVIDVSAARQDRDAS